MMYCTHCGHHNPAGANFCGQCGRPLAAGGDTTTGAFRLDEGEHAERPDLAADLLPDLAEDAGIPVAELDPGTALLVAVRGPNRGSKFLLDRDVVKAGRHPDSDIFLDDITVSRRHAEFRREGTRFRVADVGSLNGTYVNGVRCDEQLLGTGDEVQIGKFKLVLFVAEPVS